MTARSSDRPPTSSAEPCAEARRRRQAAALRANLERRRRFREARAAGGEAVDNSGVAPAVAPVATPPGLRAPRDGT